MLVEEKVPLLENKDNIITTNPRSKHPKMNENVDNAEHLLEIAADVDNISRRDKNNKGIQVLSQFGKIARFSWRKLSSTQSRSGTGTFTDVTNSDGEEERTSYNSIANEGSEIQNEINQEEENDEVPFVQFFLASKGPPQIVLLSTLFALSLGSTVGVVPTVLTEKYAVLHHGFDGICTDYNRDDKPQACLDGSSDAQAAAAAASFVSNTATFLTSSLIGALSDEYGRRNLLICAQFLSCLAPCILVLLQLFDGMDPVWYYTASATGGFVSWISIALSSLSDVMPKQWRAPMFGLVLSGFSLGFALSPVLAIFCTHFISSLISVSLLFLSFLYSVFCLPETLTPQRAAEARLQRTEYRMNANQSTLKCFTRSICRPFKELSILNRNQIFRLLSVLAFFSGMSTSADQTLLLYYVEDRLAFNDLDVAVLFGLSGIIGMLVQGIVLKQITDLVGERLVVVIAFACGATTNTLYAFANTKEIIFIAVVVSSFTGMSFPTISAIKANNAEESEQGRIQGALYALSSLANAVGPAVLRAAYEATKFTTFPGSFFMVATIFYIVAVSCACALPKNKANSSRRRSDDHLYDGIALLES